MFAGIFFGRGDMSNVESGLNVKRMGKHALCANGFASNGFASDGGAMAIAFGRARNEARLIEKFKASGIHIEANADTAQIVLAAYRLWSEDFPAMTEGCVTAAVIDVDASRLILMRDRMGEGCIYYAARASSVVFSDEYRRVLAAPFVKREISAVGIGEMFALGPASTPGLTPVDDVRAVKAGCALVCDCRGQTQKRYFDLEGEPRFDGVEKAAEKARFLVEDALDGFLGRDPCVMLSGGLDSSILAYLMAKKGKMVRAWSVEYEDNDVFYRPNGFQHDLDGAFAALACEETRAERHIVTIAPDELAGALLDAGRARGTPGMGDIDASLMLFARGMAKSENCALSGECADEVFGGYPWFHDEGLVGADGFAWSGAMDLRLSVLKSATLEKVGLRQYAALRYHESAAAKTRGLGADADENRLRTLHGMCFEWFMPVLQLRAKTMCQTSGIEVMTPFCDDRLAKYVYSLPWAVKNAGGTPKGLLKTAFSDLLPRTILERRKSPYPKTHHPRYSRAVCAAMETILNDKTQPINEICDAEAIRKIMAGGLEADARPWFGQLMSGAQLVAYLIQVNAFMRDNGLSVAL